MCEIPNAGVLPANIAATAVGGDIPLTISAFRPTGMMREAYVSYLNSIYAREAEGGYVDVED